MDVQEFLTRALENTQIDNYSRLHLFQIRKRLEYLKGKQSIEKLDALPKCPECGSSDVQFISKAQKVREFLKTGAHTFLWVYKFRCICGKYFIKEVSSKTPRMCDIHECKYNEDELCVSNPIKVCKWRD